MTQVNSANIRSGANFVAVRLPEGYPYLPRYKVAFAFSLIPYPPESSALIVLGLLKKIRPYSRLCRAFPVVSTKVSDIVRMGTYFTIGVMFLRCYERQA